MATAAEEVKKQKAKEYENYVKSVTPRHNLFKNMGFAFVSGGIICTLGQMIMNFCKNQGMDSETCGSWTSLCLIFLSVLLTGLNIYPKLANSVASPAIEYQKEGQIFGIGCKIFTIAGPVILYGILTSALLGVIYYLMKMWGIV